MPFSHNEERLPPTKWVRDFTIEPWRDRIISIMSAMGVVVPLGRAWKEGAPPWEWSGDRWSIIALFVAIGIASVTLTSED